MKLRRLTTFVVLAVAAVVAGVFVYFNFIRSDAPDAFELSASEADTASTVGDPNGTWTIAAGSQAGYRVVEDFAGGLQNFEAVGRTGEIEGTFTIDALRLTAASFVVDVASMTSDDDLRDSKFRGEIMNAAQFPTAKFVLTSPVVLPGQQDQSQSSSMTTTAEGDLTLRGVTRSVTVSLDAQGVGESIEIVGSIDVVFSDFDIVNPSIERVISVRDEGKVEFQLLANRSS